MKIKLFDICNLGQSLVNIMKRLLNNMPMQIIICELP